MVLPPNVYPDAEEVRPVPPGYPAYRHPAGEQRVLAAEEGRGSGLQYTSY